MLLFSCLQIQFYSLLYVVTSFKLFLGIAFFSLIKAGTELDITILVWTPKGAIVGQLLIPPRWSLSAPLGQFKGPDKEGCVRI